MPGFSLALLATLGVKLGAKLDERLLEETSAETKMGRDLS